MSTMIPDRPEPGIADRPDTQDTKDTAIIGPAPGTLALRPRPMTVPPHPALVLTGTDTVVHAVVEDPARSRVLRRVERDRREVIDAARQLRGPIRTVRNAHRVLSGTMQALPWVVLAGTVAALAAWLHSDRRRVPKALLIGLAVQAYRGLKPVRPRNALIPSARA